MWYHYYFHHESVLLHKLVHKETVKNYFEKATIMHKFGETTCHSESRVLFQTLRLASAAWWSRWHMKHISPLIFVGTARS